MCSENVHPLAGCLKNAPPVGGRGAWLGLLDSPPCPPKESCDAKLPCACSRPPLHRITRLSLRLARLLLRASREGQLRGAGQGPCESTWIHQRIKGSFWWWGGGGGNVVKLEERSTVVTANSTNSGEESGGGISKRAWNHGWAGDVAPRRQGVAQLRMGRRLCAPRGMACRRGGW